MSNIKLRVQLRHWTNLFIFLLTVVGNELGGGVGDCLMYLAMAVWLEQTVLVKIEQSFINLISKKVKKV